MQACVYLVDMKLAANGTVLKPELIHDLVNISCWIRVQRSWLKIKSRESDKKLYSKKLRVG